MRPAQVTFPGGRVIIEPMAHFVRCAATEDWALAATA